MGEHLYVVNRRRLHALIMDRPMFTEGELLREFRKTYDVDPVIHGSLPVRAQLEQLREAGMLGHDAGLWYHQERL